MGLRKEIIERIKKQKDCKNRLCYNLEIAPITLGRWLAKNSDSLTKADALKIISEELNTPVSKLTENKKLK